MTKLISPKCLNCNADLSGTFCSTCGQQHIGEVLSLKYLLKVLLESITNTDSRLFRTFKALISDPGNVAKRYVKGHRMQFINPIQLFLVVGGLYLAVLALNGWLTPSASYDPSQANISPTTGDFFSADFYRAWFELYTKNRLFIYLGAMPLAAIAICFVFSRSNYNYVATLVMLLYVATLYSFYGIIITTVYAVFDLPFLSSSRKMAEGVVGMCVYYQTIRSFYNQGWLKSGIMTLVVFTLLLVSAYSVTFITSWLIINW